MTPTKTPSDPQPIVNDVAGPAPMPAPRLVDDIPVHASGQAPGSHSEDAELDRIMQDVGKEMHKDDGLHKKHHFWELSHQRKKEANFSTQSTIKNVPQAAAPKPQSAPSPRPPAPINAQSAPKAHTPSTHTRVKPVANKPSKKPKASKPPKQRHVPVMVAVITILVTAALIAVAYRTYQ